MFQPCRPCGNRSTWSYAVIGSANRYSPLPGVTLYNGEQE